MQLTVILSVFAVLVSLSTALYAVFSERRVSNREVTSAVIGEYYTAIRSLTQIQIQLWQLAHLFEVAENYERVVGTLRTITPVRDVAKIVELRIQERAVALFIFSIYEHVVYQIAEAIRASDGDRTVFLSEAADYFTGRLLNNPRLCYLWAPSGGNLSCEFEESTRLHHSSKVTCGPDGWDAMGPYGSL